MSESKPRNSFGLYGRFGAGKSLQAASFLAPGEKAIILNAEFGPEESAGGLTTLLHGGDIYPSRIDPENILVLTVTSWEDMQNHYAWLRQERMQLVADGYTLLILDSGTALSYIIQKAIIDMEPERGPNVKRHTLIGDFVQTLDRRSTSMMELGYYPKVTERYIEMHGFIKQLPFTFVTTFAEKDAYDEETRKIKIGIGPKLIGKELPAMIPGEVDAMFHCEQQVDAAGHVQYVWLTDNDPARFGNDCMYVAKHRFGRKLERFEPADGLALLTKIGAR